MANELHAFDTSSAIMTVDRVLAAVNMAHDVVQDEVNGNPRVDNAWLILQLAQEKLQDLRLELERAEMVECGSQEVTSHG